MPRIFACLALLLPALSPAGANEAEPRGPKLDVESYRRWWDYSRAYDEMIRMTDTRHAPWWIVPSNDKKRARINCISHILSSIPYEKVPFDEPKLGKRQKRPDDYVEDNAPRNMVPDVF